MNNKSNALKSEAKRLYDTLDFGVHWIKEKSKAPVKAKWAEHTRDSWESLEKGYRPGYGLGVRLGFPSKIDDHYLANIDIDIKSSDKRHHSEAIKIVKKHFPGLWEKAPRVKTGYGYRLFFRTKKPFPSGKITQSKETCEVLLPTVEPRGLTLKLLSKEKISEGYRVRPAFEVEAMSEGRQVLLPPTIHPETGQIYIWDHFCPERPSDIPIFNYGGPGKNEKNREKQTDFKFNLVPDLDLTIIPESIRSKIIDGTGSGTDRSAEMLTCSMVMLRHGLTDDEILTIFTDKSLYLGAVVYDSNHRKTTNRAYAAQWVNDYTLKKAKDTISAETSFKDEVMVWPDFKDEEKDKENWKQRIEGTGKYGEGPPKNTIKNIILILEHGVGHHLFERDEFLGRDFNTQDQPWGSKKDVVISDTDLVNIKVWLGKKYRFEPSVGTINEAVEHILSKNAFHPVREWYKTLVWDGNERIDKWLKKYYHAEGSDEYLAQIFRKWMVASVTRVMKPGTKFDWLPIFQGEQGIGKSTFGSILFTETYFTDWLPQLSDKDAALGLQGKLCVEFGELAVLNKNEIENTKAFITRTTDNVRPPYGKRKLEFARQNVFFGTTNRETYLKDDSGNRRFVPVKVGQLDFNALKRDREQLWAEALWTYENGLEDELYLTGDAKEELLITQASKMVEDDSHAMEEKFKSMFFDDEGKEKTIEGQVFNSDKFKLIDALNLIETKNEQRFRVLMVKMLKRIGAKNWKSDGNKYWCWVPK